jgi:hypothetical protein
VAAGNDVRDFHRREADIDAANLMARKSRFGRLIRSTHASSETLHTNGSQRLWMKFQQD